MATGLPVTIAANGLGIPVVDSVNGPLATTCNFGMPVVIATNGYGVPLNLAGAAPGPGWTPAQLAGLIGWWMADVGVTQAAGAVSAWADQSGAGHNVTQSGAPKPVYNATSFNNKQGITFSSTYLQSGTYVQGGTNKMSCFAAAKKITTIGTNDVWVSYSGPPSANFYDNVGSAGLLTNTGTGNAVGGYRVSQLDDQAIVLGTSYRVGSIFDGTNHTAYINNVASGSPVASSGNFISPGLLMLGAGLVSGAPAGGSNICLAEIIVTNTAVSATDRNNIETYLFNKWWGSTGYLINKDSAYILNKDSAYIRSEGS